MKINLQGSLIGSEQVGGLAGTVTIQCDNTGIITVSNPIAVGTGAVAVFISGASYGASVSQASVIKASISKGQASTTAVVSSGVYQINAYIDNGATALPPGHYAISVTTTLVAN